MKLKFKEWLDSSKFSKNVDHLFNSGITCYKNEIYTAALHMSYLGFLVALKERLMTANMPANFPLQDWKDIMKDLQDEELWESRILNSIMQKPQGSTQKAKKDPVFNVNENLRDQVTFWKNRRNDCVHNKDNEVTNAHVEIFWSFIQSNLPKFTVEGGMESLLNELRRHCDNTYTPINSDISPLVSKIKDSVEKSNLSVFWDKSFEILENLIDYNNEVNFIHNVFKIGDDVISESIIVFLKTQLPILMAYITEYPQNISKFYSEKHDIRKLWNSYIQKSDKPYRIYTYLLRNEMIPEEELDDSNNRMLKIDKYNWEKEDNLILEENKFGEAIFKKLFVDKKTTDIKYWEFLNNNRKLCIQYLLYFNVNDESLKIFHREFSKETWYPERLQNELKAIFKNDNKKREIFSKKLEKLGLNWPKNLED